MTKNFNAQNKQTATAATNPFHRKILHTNSKPLKTFCRKYHPNISLCIIFKTPRPISSFFPNKDFLPALHLSSLVYNYKCGSCNASYIGKTTRHLQTRADEHNGISWHTGHPIYSSIHSSISDHCHQTGHAFDSEFFTIFTTARISYELMTKESILIHHHLPTLNANQSSSFFAFV